MAKRKKPNLKSALKKVDKTPDSFFGVIDIDINSLPCITKPEKEKITANFDADLLAEIKAAAKKMEKSQKPMHQHSCMAMEPSRGFAELWACTRQRPIITCPIKYGFPDAFEQV